MKLGTKTFAVAGAITFAAISWAQGGGRGPQVVSPVVGEDRRITFRILAPQAESVKLNGSDIPGNGQGAAMTKGENGVPWVSTVVLTPKVAYGATRPTEAEEDDLHHRAHHECFISNSVKTTITVRKHPDAS